MKKVLIVTSSPFNNTKLGKMCSQIVCHFQQNQSLAVVAAWDHDTSWYMQDENNLCWYEKNGQKICPVYPVFNKGEGAANQLYDLAKALQIETILSIGDFDDIHHIYAIKTLEKDNIEWINILNNGSVPINDNKKEIINSIDYHIVLNEETEKEFERLEIPKNKWSRQKYGSVFREGPKKITDKFGVACVAKNCNQSNLGCFITTVQLLKKCLPKEKFDDMRFYLHTNLYEGGDYDIEYLLDRYDVKDCIELPEDFIGINDGVSDDSLKEKLQNYDVIVDCSCQSATGISVLDGMALGLIPVVSEVGSLGEIGRKFTESSASYSNYRISGVNFIAADEKQFFIAKDVDIMGVINELSKLHGTNQLSGLSSEAQKLSNSYNLEAFLENTYKIIKDFQLNSNKLVVETF